MRTIVSGLLITAKKNNIRTQIRMENNNVLVKLNYFLIKLKNEHLVSNLTSFCCWMILYRGPSVTVSMVFIIRQVQKTQKIVYPGRIYKGFGPLPKAWKGRAPSQSWTELRWKRGIHYGDYGIPPSKTESTGNIFHIRLTKNFLLL